MVAEEAAEVVVVPPGGMTVADIPIFLKINEPVLVTPGIGTKASGRSTPTTTTSTATAAANTRPFQATPISAATTATGRTSTTFEIKIRELHRVPLLNRHQRSPQLPRRPSSSGKILKTQM